MNEANPGEALHAQEPGAETPGPQSGTEAPVPTAAEQGAGAETRPGAPVLHIHTIQVTNSKLRGRSPLSF
ncbi:MAG: hypothetical protein IKI17_00265, partial [Oscillospiraceae bacterium]|nr:hypothetical protein [Oscillospiraceae bacterium]